ncbi:MAG: hypothetical protein KF795_14770 [Labilithrix sp.]|nr:hypothetical protein [Labilithrix sp.]
MNFLLTPYGRLVAPSFLLVAVALSFGGAGCSEDESGPSGTSASSSGSSGSSGISDDAGSSGSSGTSGSSGSKTESKNEVDLTFTGDITATLKGKAGTCGGVPGGASFQVRSADLGVDPAFELAVVILEEEDWPQPTTVLNVTSGDKASYTWSKTAGTVVAQRDRSRVDFDVELGKVAAAGKVTVKGSIVCND